LRGILEPMAGQCLIRIGGHCVRRWLIEECFGAARNEVGLDEYQVRRYDAWHRQMTLAMLAHSFLTITPHHAKEGPETGRQLTSQNDKPDNPPAPDPPPIHRRLIPLTLAEIRRLLHIHRDQRDDQTKIAHALHWSKWRRTHQTHARRCHFRRRLCLQALMI